VSLYELSRACYELRDEAKRQQYRSNPAAYAACFNLSAGEREMFLKLNWRGLAESGVSIYVLTKLGATVNVEFLELEGAMRNMSKQQFVEFLGRQAKENQRFALGVD
jgi:hypothetical protein